MVNEILLQKIASNVRIFNGMPRQCLIDLLDGADKWQVRKGDFYFSEGESGTSFFVLIAGEAAVEMLREGHRVNLARLQAGDCFGEMALVDARPRSASVRALSECIALRFSRDKLDANMTAAAHVYRNISRLLVRRLIETNHSVANLTVELAALQGINVVSAEDPASGRGGHFY